MDKVILPIGGKNCIIYTSGVPKVLLVQPVMSDEDPTLDEEAALIEEGAGRGFVLAAFVTKDWNGELSPWKAPAVFKDNDFAGRADETLWYIIKEMLPYLYEECGISPDLPRVIGGYSMGGLFAIYCSYRTDHFAGIAASSPSVWFPGWIEYARENSVLTKVVYLSLGEKEEHTKNRVMASVGANIREMADIYSHSSVIRAVTLRWNEGNHFSEPHRRTAAGFVWVCRNM